MIAASVLIVVPAFNEEALIGRCLESLFTQTVARTVYDVVIALDSRTTDKTAYICKQYPCDVCLDDEHHTIGGACAKATSGCVHPIIAGTEADCIVPSTWISTIISMFDADPSTIGISGPVLAEPGASPMARFLFWQMNYLYRTAGILLGRSYYPGMNYAYRTSAFDQAGGFANISAGYDNDLSIRVGRGDGRMKFVSQLKIATSVRRLRAGHVHNALYYGKLFWNVNRSRPTTKPPDIR